MQLNQKDLYIGPEISKKILNAIHNGGKIEYKKFNLEKHKSKIEKLKKDFKLKKNEKNFFVKNHFFWELALKRYKNLLTISVKKKDQKSKKDKYDVNYQEISKSLGYNPTLLSLIIFENKIKKILKTNNFFKELEKSLNLENIDISAKINILRSFNNKEINIFTPLCPDYDHVKISENLFKYTFNYLGESYGLIGKKYLKIFNIMNDLFKKHEIKFSNHIYYGDFEAFSEINCKNLKESEQSFIQKVEKSAIKMKKKCKPTSCGLIVKDLTTKKEWLKLCKKNRKKIVKLFNLDQSFKRKVIEICSSRKNLYESWFPEKRSKDYLDIIFDQGAEYTSLSDIVKKKFKNPFFICLDHSKMKIFYNINNSVPVVYSKPHYL